MSALWEWLILFGLGILAGAMNTIAGGGSTITLPFLIFMGLPPHIANATNRVGTFITACSATYHFRKRQVIEDGLSLEFVIPSCLGSSIGAFISTDLDEDVFRKLIALVLLGSLLSIVFKSRIPTWSFFRLSKFNETWLKRLGLFLLGLYGGFIQVGIGFLLLAFFSNCYGMNLMKSNGIKVLLVSVFTIPALGTFIYYDLIEWHYAFALATGALGGGWLGTHLATSLGEAFVKVTLVIVVSLSAIKLLFGY